MRPAAKSPGFPPSCWLLCMQEVSGLEAVVHVLLHHSTRCCSPAGAGDSHLIVVRTTKILLKLGILSLCESKNSLNEFS